MIVAAMPARAPANTPETLRLVLRQFRRARRGAAALEFALVSMPLVMLLIGIMSFSYAFFLQFALDFSLQQAVRQIQIGNVAGSTASTAFVASVMCPIFSQFASCTGLLVSVQQVPDYLAAYATITSPVQTTTFCTGQPGTLMFARASYQAPVWATFMVSVLATSPSSTGQNIVSAVAFANENPSGVAVASAAGC